MKKYIDKINGYAYLLRFVTPILLAFVIFILNDIKGDVNCLKIDTKEQFSFVTLQFNNHLAHHQLIEKEFFERLTKIEAENNAKLRVK